MAVQMSDSHQLISDEEDEPTPSLRNGRKRAEPKKRKQPKARGRSRRPCRIHINDIDGEFESADDIIPSNYNRPTNNHDYDTIVLDCDDIFKGGPSVQITRDLGGANSCITDDNTELQVNVRVNGKVNKYTMRRVC